MALIDVMLALYASEINCGIESFWDAGWTAWIGDTANGEVRAPVELDNAAEWLHRAAVERFPNSDYAVSTWNK